MTNNTTKRKKRCDHKKQSAWAKKIAPTGRKALAAARKKEKAGRVVPEISTNAWLKIEPILSNPNNTILDTYNFMEATGYGREWVSRKKWLDAIAREFPDVWEVDTDRRRKVLKRKGSQ